MKKRITIFALILCFAVAFTSCNKKNNEVVSVGKILSNQFNEILKNDKNISLENLAEKLVENEVIPFGPVVMPVEEGYLNGFKSEIHGFSEGEIFAPMIGAIPFIGYLFRSENPAALMNTLKTNADLRWNVCTEADEMIIENTDDIVLFIMSPENFDEE